MVDDSPHPVPRLRRYLNAMESTAELRENLKRLIVERLNLIDVTPDDIGDDMPLFKTGLGLDSIDALELTLNVEREYGVKVANSEQALEAFQSVARLAEFIETRRQAVA
jgi:acyl carrier protein